MRSKKLSVDAELGKLQLESFHYFLCMRRIQPKGW